jgi:osmotically-inducible protein OsmY
MKAIHGIRMAVEALLVMVSIQVYAQSTETLPSGGMSRQGAIAQHKADSAANGTLGRKVRGALSKAMGISASHITVRSVNGDVTLQGSVPGPADSEKAEKIAKSIEGVASVKNALSIRPEGR